MKLKKIYSIHMAVYLRKQGCKIVDTEVNINKPEFDVWLFEDNEKLHRAIDMYMKQRNK